MKINHTRVLLSALRTAIIFISGFIVYDILKEFEYIWNKESPNNKIAHFRKKKIIHFIFIFILDIILLYMAFYLINLEL
jgi:hypothetical protein